MAILSKYTGTLFFSQMSIAERVREREGKREKEGERGSKCTAEQLSIKLEQQGEVSCR